MRKITQKAIDAMVEQKNFASSNTTVKSDGLFTIMYLHGNAIASVGNNTGSVFISDAGWQTNTTKERLNGLPNVSLRQHKGKWLLCGAPMLPNHWYRWSTCTLSWQPCANPTI